MSRRHPGIDQIIGEDEIIHPWIHCNVIAQIQHDCRLECGHVIDGDRLHDGSTHAHRDLGECAVSDVLLCIDVIRSDIMNAIASAGQSDTSIVRKYVAEYESAGYVTDGDIANGHIRHLANWANVPGAVRLILGTEQNCRTVLGEAAPGVFQDVRFEQNPLSILKFKVILHNEGIARGPPDVSRLTFHPDHGFEQVIAPNLDVCRGDRGCAASKENAFAGGLEEVIDNLEGSSGLVAATSGNRLGIHAGPRYRCAMEI